MEPWIFDFSNDTVAIHIFIKGLWDIQNSAEKMYEKDPQTLSKGYQTGGEAEHSSSGYSHSVITYSE